MRLSFIREGRWMSLVKFFFHLWHKTASSVEAVTAAVNSWVQEPSVSRRQHLIAPLSSSQSFFYFYF